MNPRSRKPWRVLFEDEEKLEFLEAVEGIAESIAEPGPAVFPKQERFGHQEIQGAGYEAELAGGRAGMALFFYYRSLANGHRRECEIAEYLLNQALEMIPMAPPHYGLFSGLPGVAWAVAHIQAHQSDDPKKRPHPAADEDPFTVVDRLLVSYLSSDKWDRNFDLVSGLIGIGVYALERLPRPDAKAILSLVLKHLTDLAQEQDTGIAWLTPPSRLPEEALAQSPAGYFDLGVAHGNPGVIGFLGAACAAGWTGIKPLLAGAIAWMLEQRPIAGTGALFPYWTAPGVVNDRTTRLGWCYGAPGISVALMNAGLCSGNPAWSAEALDLALKAAELGPEDTRIRDAGLCHGAAGAGHLFNRMYQATGHEELGTAARFWLRKALSMRRPGCGTGGFLAYFPGEEGQDPWVEDAGLLTGSAGIGLAFLAAATTEEPQWDRMLLASVPLGGITA